MKDLPTHSNYKGSKENPAYNPYEIVRKVILPFWPVFLITLVIAYFAGKTYLRFQTPLYEVYAKILLKVDGGIEQSILKELNVFSAQKSVENEMEILRSSNITDDIARRLNTYIQITQMGDISKVVMNYEFPWKLEAINEDSIHSISDLEIIFNPDFESFQINGKKLPLKNQIIRINKTQYRLTIDIESMLKINVNTPYRLSIWDIKSAAAQLSTKLRTTQIGENTTIIGIKYQDPNVINAQRIVNEVLQSYMSSSVADKRKSAQFSLDFIDSRLRLINGELDSVERKIERFKLKNGIIDLSAQANLYLNTVKETDQRMANIDLQLSVLQDIEQYINGKIGNSGIVPSTMGIDEPLLNNLLKRLFDLESEKSKRQKISGVNDEVYLGFEDEIDKVKRAISDNIQSIRSNLKISKSQINAELISKNSLLNQIPEQERRLIDISRQQTIKNEIYTFLLQKREESAISYAATVSDVRIIEKAFGGTKISPKPNLVYVTAFSLGIFIPLILLFILIMLNPKIQFRNELEYLTEIPIVGEIMFDKQKRNIVVGLKDRSLISESLRTIRTKLSHIKGVSNSSCKTILVSSSIPGEGKTFLSVNLGISYSLTGKKVLLVGGDMRKPTLHRPFKLQSRKGLSSFLSGASDIETVIFPTEFDNLFIIPSGVIPPNPTELFESETMSNLMAELKSRFDVVIVDSPPLGLVSDAELLAKYCDISLFVVRQNRTFKDAVVEVLEKANTNGVFNNIMMVFNGVKPTGIGKYAYYGYGYGGYGYGGYGYGGYGYYGGGVKKTGYGYYMKRLFKLNS